MLHCVEKKRKEEEERVRTHIQYLTDRNHKSAYVYCTGLKLRICLFIASRSCKASGLNHQNRISSAFCSCLYSQHRTKELGFANGLWWIGRSSHPLSTSCVVLRVCRCFLWLAYSMRCLFISHYSVRFWCIVISVRYPKHTITHGIIIIHRMWLWMSVCVCCSLCA